MARHLRFPGMCCAEWAIVREWDRDIGLDVSAYELEWLIGIWHAVTEDRESDRGSVRGRGGSPGSADLFTDDLVTRNNDWHVNPVSTGPS